MQISSLLGRKKFMTWYNAIDIKWMIFKWSSCRENKIKSYTGLKTKTWKKNMLEMYSLNGIQLGGIVNVFHHFHLRLNDVQNWSRFWNKFEYLIGQIWTKCIKCILSNEAWMIFCFHFSNFLERCLSKRIRKTNWLTSSFLSFSFGSLRLGGFASWTKFFFHLVFVTHSQKKEKNFFTSCERCA